MAYLWYRYRARKQAADSAVGRLLTRAVAVPICAVRFNFDRPDRAESELLQWTGTPPQ